jgi:cytochrome b6-f complex iron-sulfur subunit
LKKQKYKAESESELKPRRNFLLKIWVGLGAVAFAEMVWLVVSFLWPRKSREKKHGSKGILEVGSADAFLVNSVTPFPRGRFYLARLKDGGFLAVHRRCTHLGCTVAWDEDKKQFLCPCHSSVFDIRGAVVQPPAPRAMDLFPVTIENNQVRVDTGRVIQRSGFAREQVAYPEKLS